jgi:AcrR family transcriptional regulator
MTIANRKERQKEELRAKILQAAKVLFIEKGFEETSIRNIAEKIEYSPTTIYLYFKDKDDIFHAVHQEGFKLLLNQYFKPLSHVKAPFERLKAISLAYITFAVENPELYHLMFINKVVIDSIVLGYTIWSIVHGICSLKICCRNTVVSAENQEDITEKAGQMAVELLERMYKK